MMRWRRGVLPRLLHAPRHTPRLLMTHVAPFGGGGRAGEEIRTKEHPIFLNVIGTKKAKSFKRPKRSVCEPVRS